MTDLFFSPCCFRRVVEEPFIVIWRVGSHGLGDGWAGWMRGRWMVADK